MYGLSSQVIYRIQQHIMHMSEVINVIYYLIIIYLTTDKLLEIKLNIRHPVYWNQKKATYLLVSTWFTAISVCIVISITHELVTVRMTNYLYVHVVFDCIVILIAVYTYGYIFVRYTKANSMISRFIVVGCTVLPSAGETISRPGIFTIFRKSNFYVPCLLIINF